MFLSQIQINPRILGDLYDIHRKVMAFANSPGKRVLYRTEIDDFCRILVLTEKPPLNGIAWGKVATKPYNPVVNVGRKYRFKLLANTTYLKKNKLKCF